MLVSRKLFTYRSGWCGLPKHVQIGNVYTCCSSTMPGVAWPISRQSALILLTSLWLKFSSAQLALLPKKNTAEKRLAQWYWISPA